jgi:hypothetical protein
LVGALLEEVQDEWLPGAVVSQSGVHAQTGTVVAEETVVAVPEKA